MALTDLECRKTKATDKLVKLSDKGAEYLKVARRQRNPLSGTCATHSGTTFGHANFVAPTENSNKRALPFRYVMAYEPMTRDVRDVGVEIIMWCLAKHANATHDATVYT